MVPEARRLQAALVSAFPAHVTAAFSEHGYPLDRAMAETIEEATAFLDAELGAELEQAYREQRHSPLEIFRAAIQVVVQALRRAGVRPIASEASLGETDPYGLMPGGSAVLGPDVREAHVAWGATKASAFSAGRSATVKRPVILLVTADREDRDTIAPSLRSPGVDCLTARNPAAVATAIEQQAVLIAFVDLAHRSARDAVAQLTEAHVPTSVYGDGVDDLTETGLLAQGVRTVIRRYDFVADPAGFLPPLA